MKIGIGVLLAPVMAAALLSSASAQTPAPPAGSPPPSIFPTIRNVADGAGHPGQAIYQQACASCHDHAEAMRAPTKATLQAMNYQAINFALTRGKMKVQAATLTDRTRAELINYLTGKNTATLDTWSAGHMCAGPRVADLSGAATVATFGFDKDNTRALTARQTGLTRAGLAGVKPAWALGFPDVTMMRSQAAVVGTTVFLPVAELGKLYALSVKDAARPCVSWVYTAPGAAPLRTSAAFGTIADGRKVLAFSGQDSTVHVIDARDGRPIWTKNVGDYSYSLTTGTPRVLKDRIIVPVSQYEIMQASDNRVQCCTNHGFVLSLDPKTGAQQWRYDTMEAARPVRDRGDGQMLWGPSGAPIWNSPVVDEKRGLIYFGTGESNSPPVSKNTDALIAISLKDGHEVWSMQATAMDVFNVGCGKAPRNDQFNCVSDTVYRDVDFGASLVLATLSGGKQLLLAGQKSGTAWALDPATGKVVWRTDIGSGAPNGGIHWGIAFHDDTLFVPVAVVGKQLPNGPAVDSALQPGLYALNAKTGAIKWSYYATSDCLGDRKTRAPRCAAQFGFSGAPSVIGGAVIAGSLDGRLYAFDEKTGAKLWEIDTVRTQAGVNGIDAKGGSIDGPSITAVNGLLLVNSGYGMFGQIPGNSLLAFKPGS